MDFSKERKKVYKLVPQMESLMGLKMEIQLVLLLLYKMEREMDEM